jgi:hypothetical protein
VPREFEDVVFDGANEDVPLDLGVNSEGSVGVLGADLVGVRVIVAFEEVSAAHDDGIVWAQDSEFLAVLRVSQFRPIVFVSQILVL